MNMQPLACEAILHDSVLSAAQDASATAVKTGRRLADVDTHDAADKETKDDSDKEVLDGPADGENAAAKVSGCHVPGDDVQIITQWRQQVFVALRQATSTGKAHAS